MREQIKKQLLDSLEPANDNNVKDLKIKSDELSVNLENAIFEITGKNSKDKSYREKTKKIITRLKGTRNQNVRILLKCSIITVDQLCTFSDKQVDDDAYFNKIASENNIGSKVSETNVKGKLPKINIPVQSLDLLKSQEINNTSTMEEYYSHNNQESINAQNNNLNSQANSQNQLNSDLNNIGNDTNLGSNTFNNFGETVSSNYILDENNTFNPNNTNLNNDFASQNTNNSNNFEMLGHPLSSNNTSSTNGNLHFQNNYDDGFMVISKNNNKNMNINNDMFSNSISQQENNFDISKKIQEKEENINSDKNPSISEEKKNIPPQLIRPVPGNYSSNMQIQNLNNKVNKPSNTINYNKTIDIGELTNEQNFMSTNSNRVNMSYNANLTENEIENANDSCNMSTSVKESGSPSLISDKLSELRKMRQKRQNKNLNMPLTLKSNSNLSNILSDKSINKNNIAYYNNPNEIDDKLNQEKTNMLNTQKIQNLNIEQNKNNPRFEGNFRQDELNPSNKIIESGKNNVNDKISNHEDSNVNLIDNSSSNIEISNNNEKNLFSQKKNPFDDEIPLNKKSTDNKILDKANIQLKLEEFSNANNSIHNFKNQNFDENTEHKAPPSAKINIHKKENEDLKRKNPFDGNNFNTLNIVSERNFQKKEKQENFYEDNFDNNFHSNEKMIIDGNGETNSYRRNQQDLLMEKEQIPSNDQIKEINIKSLDFDEIHQNTEFKHKLTFDSNKEEKINKERQIDELDSNNKTNMYNNDLKIESTSNKRKDLNNLYLSNNFNNNNSRSSAFENIKVNKSANEKILILETNLDLANKKNEIYELEIKNLREKIAEIRLNIVNSNEEVLKLEISKIKSNLQIKEQANSLLTTENQNLKNKVINLENTINKLMNDHQYFRKQTEQILTNQQVEFECLLKNKIEELSNFRIQHLNNEHPNANANDNNSNIMSNVNNYIFTHDSMNNNLNTGMNLTENAANVYIRENDTMNLVTNNNQIPNLNCNFITNNQRKENSNIEESHLANNWSNNANDLNFGMNNPNNYNNKQYEENIDGGENIEENYYANNENNFEENNYNNNRTNGNPFGGDDRGSDNYLNGNVYDEIKNKDDNLNRHKFYARNNNNDFGNFNHVNEIDIGGNNINNFNCNNNIFTNNDVYENYENNINHPYEDFDCSNKIGNTGDAFNDCYLNNNANTPDIKKAESGATNATKDVFGCNEEESNPKEIFFSNPNKSNIQTINYSTDDHKINNKINNKFNLNKRDADSPKGEKIEEKDLNRSQGNIDKNEIFQQNSNIFENYENITENKINNNANCFFENIQSNSQTNNVLNQRTKEIFINEKFKNTPVSNLPKTLPVPTLNQIKSHKQDLTKSKVPSDNKLLTNDLNQSITNKPSHLFGDDDDTESIFSKGLTTLDTKIKAPLNKIQPTKLTGIKDLSSNNDDKNAIKNKSNNDYLESCFENLNNSKLSEKNNNKLNSNNTKINQNSNIINENKNNNLNNVFNNSNIIENPNNSLFDDGDSNSFFGHNNSMMNNNNKIENIFANKIPLNSNSKINKLNSNNNNRISNLNTNKKPSDNKTNNKRINIFENNNFENEKNAFDFFDKKDENAGNIFESLSRNPNSTTKTKK